MGRVKKTLLDLRTQSLVYNNLTNRERFDERGGLLPFGPILPEPILYESHCHTPLCNHAEGEPAAYAEAALQAGFKGIIFTCHSPLPDNHSAWVRMRPTEYETYHQMIAAARETYAGRVDVRAGLESDYYPGVEPWLEELHARQPLNHVLGSVHPQLQEFRDRHFNGDGFAFQKTYFDQLAEAAETGLFDTISHPDLVKNLVPDEWRFALIQPHVEEALDRIAATGVAMELNTSGLLKTISEMNPGRDMLALMYERKIPVVIGADAHVPWRVGADYVDALNTLRDVGYEEINVFLDRTRHPIAITDALASLDGTPSSPAK